MEFTKHLPWQKIGIEGNEIGFVRLVVKKRNQQNEQKESLVEDIRPKVDHNINLAGLLITDADSLKKKLSRVEEGPLKGLYVFEKKLGNGTVYICNGAEFPNAEAMDFILYMLYKLEQNDWPVSIKIESLNALIKEVFGVKHSGKNWYKRLERILIIWLNHKFFFKNCFVWDNKTYDTVAFGVINNFAIIKRGKGKPAVLTITFDPNFIGICEKTEWYRRPPWLEVRKLRKETAKNLYLLALEYKPDTSKKWKIFLANNLIDWYRNALNSLAEPENLRPSIVLRLLKRAIEEINQKTNLRMELQQTEEGNYCITVEEIAPPGAEKVEIPFDKLSPEDKALLVAYLEAVAGEKGIENIWGFLRSMTTRQVQEWLEKAKQYFESEVQTDEETEPVEKPRLIEILREWGRKQFGGETPLFRVYFGKDKILKAYETNKRVIFVCADEILAKLILERFEDKLSELKELFGKEVEFRGEDLS